MKSKRSPRRGQIGEGSGHAYERADHSPTNKASLPLARVPYTDAKGRVTIVTLEHRRYVPSLHVWHVELPKSHRPQRGWPLHHRLNWIKQQIHASVLPRGWWTMADATEIMFDKDYIPMWRRSPDGVVSEADPTEFFEWEVQSYLHDFNDPKKNPETLKLLMAILDAWGVVI